MNNKGYIFIVRRLGKQSKLILSRLDSISNLKLNLRIHGQCGPYAHAGADLQAFLFQEESEKDEEEDPSSDGVDSSSEEEMAMAGEGLDFLRYWLWEEGVCCGEEPIRVRLNSEKVEDGSAVFTFYEEPVAETLRLPWWLQCG